MNFLRPEVKTALIRWREVLAASALAGLGLWIALDRGRILPEFGWILVAIGMVMGVLAARRTRFAGSGQAPGVVGLVEGRVTYMGPHYGGAISLDDLTALSLRRSRDGQAYWVLTEIEQELVIPADARGAEVLFDAFTRLDGLSITHLMAVLKGDRPGTHSLWQQGSVPALTR